MTTCKHCGQELTSHHSGVWMNKEGSSWCSVSPNSFHGEDLHPIEIDWHQLVDPSYIEEDPTPTFWQRHRVWLLPVLGFVVGFVLTQLFIIFYLNG